jgi:formylglycine-generating enzyme required for sulfatase activity
VKALAKCFLCFLIVLAAQKSGSDSKQREKNIMATTQMLFIPAGEFEMGISKEHAESLVRDFFTPESDMNPALFYNEVPEHKVKVSGFNISKFEITNKEFKEFVDAGGYKNKDYWKELINIQELNTDSVGWDRINLFKDRTGAFGPLNWKDGKFPEGKADHPVEGVSWFEAIAYCRWSKLRLPSEEEWEYAARGTDKRMFPWGNGMDVIMNWGDHQAGETSPVGSIPGDRSAFGVMDMARNVKEWVGDQWHPYPDSPLGKLEKSEEEYGILRGGWYISIPYQMRTTVRERASRLNRMMGIGFRCAK